MVDYDVIKAIVNRYGNLIENKQLDILFYKQAVAESGLAEFFYKDLSIPILDYMTRIPPYMFSRGCEIDTLVIPGNIQLLCTDCITNTNIKHIIIQEGVGRIEPRTISKNDYLQDIIIENGPTTIPQLFCSKDNPELRKVFIPKTVKTIQYDAFNEDTKIITPFREDDKDRLQIPEAQIEMYKNNLRFTHEKVGE